MSKQKTEEFFKDIVYVNYDEYIINQVARNLTPEEIADKKILDYGCGSGCVSYYLLKYHPWQVTGIDVGERNIEYANDRIKKYGYQNIKFICADLEHYSFGAETYDVIWSDTVIEVINIPLEALIKSFYDLLNPHGILYVSFTKKNIKNKIIFTVTSILSKIVPRCCRILFSYLLLPTYYAANIFSRKANVNTEQFKNKAAYLFIPYLRLISTDEIVTIMKNANFSVCYVRDRIKSDVNSPDHIEIKAIKQ